MNHPLQQLLGPADIPQPTGYCVRLAGTGAALALLLLSAWLSTAAAQDAAEPVSPGVDISNWKCKFCEFEEGWYGDVTLGLGYVADDSYRFGEYNGLQEKGGFLIGEASARYRGEDAAYLDLSASEFGLDSRSLAIEGGRQGSYDLFLRYDELPHFVSDSASTPYLGSGTDTLRLPAGWVDGGTTAGMTALGSSLRPVDIETQRKRVGTGISITTESPWSYSVNLSQDDKEGSKRGAGAFFFSSAQLVEPVDYVTDEIEAAISYTQKKWQARLGYYVSTFTNNNESLTWDNPFTPIVAGADQGQLALPPDNEFQQISLSGAYQINDRNHVGADFAVGRMEQDERLLQATLNPNLVVPPLPTDSADALVDTTNAKLRFVTTPGDRLRLSAYFSYDERDNKTPQLLYDWVSTDAFVASQRANLPYSYTRSSTKLKADYDYAKGTRLGIGYDIDERERTFQEVDKTDEDTLWGSVRLRNIDNIFLEFKLAFSERDASAHEVVAEIDPPQNVLMKKYNMADRDRTHVAVYASFVPRPDYSVGLSIDSARDDYDDSELGLTQSSDNSVNVDVTALLADDVSATFFVGRQNIESSQAGSQSFDTADWFASIDDTFDNFGVGLNYVLVKDTLDIGFDYSKAKSSGVIEVDIGGPGTAFPELRTDLDSIRIYLNYRLDEDLSLRAAYWYEEFDSSDWALEGVEPGTVPNLLAFGETSPSYSNNVVKLSLMYTF